MNGMEKLAVFFIGNGEFLIKVSLIYVLSMMNIGPIYKGGVALRPTETMADDLTC